MNFHTSSTEITVRILVCRFEHEVLALNESCSRCTSSCVGIIWSSGQRWLDLRRFTKKTLKEFGYAKPKEMNESLNDSANQLIEGIKTELFGSAENVLYVYDQKFSIHVLNIVWNLAGGYKFDANDESLQRNKECVNRADFVFGHSNLYNMFPFLKTWFPKKMKHKEHVAIHNEIHDFTKVINSFHFNMLKCIFV